MTAADGVHILLVAFGTVREEAWAVYDRLADEMRRRHPGHPVSWAFTASAVRRRLAEAGTPVASPTEALVALREAGYERVAVQPFYVIPGEEFARVDELAVAGMRLAIGAPLLADEADRAAVVEALALQVRPGVPNVVVAHGNERQPALNQPYRQLAVALRERFANVVLATLEGPPGTAPLEAIAPAARRCGAVHFIPLLIVAGRHVRHDVMGNHPESWRHRIGAAATTCAPPLGDNPAIAEIYLRHLDRALGELG